MGMDVIKTHVQIQDWMEKNTGIHVSPLYFVDRHCPATWRLDDPELWCHDLTWVLGGRACYRVDGNAVELCAGDMLYVPKGVRRQAETDAEQPMHCLALNFLVRNEAGENCALPFPQRFAVPHTSGVEPIFRAYQNNWMEKEPGYQLVAQALLLQILLSLMRTLSRSEKNEPGREVMERISRIRSRIAENCTEPLTVAQLAEEEGLHPVYFGQMFKQHVGMTIREYLARARVYKANELLETGGYSVAEVAERCGFSDPFHFSRVYRKLEGIPPSRLLR